MSRDLRALLRESDAIDFIQRRLEERARSDWRADTSLHARYDDLESYLIESVRVDGLIERLQHYFLTYKLVPGEPVHARIARVYGRAHARKVVRAAMDDYGEAFGGG